MDRNREARRLTVAAATNGLSRRRHRASNLRYSPEEDAPFESPETARLRDRGASLKKERDRERDRERERENDRDRLRSKRRRGERLMMHGNRDDGGEDSSQESINVDEEEADGDGGGGPIFSSKMLPPSNSTPPSFSSSLANHQTSSGSLQHRKSFPPPAKVIRTTVTSPVASPVVSTWKPADEMIGVSVPRKARSASTKRSHEPWSSGATGVVFTSSEQIHRQRSTSPARASPASMLTPSSPPAPTSPSSSSVSARKKMKPMGQKQRPPKSTSSKPSSSPVENEIEIEIAEVLYGMMRQPSVPSKEETTGNDSTTLDNKSTSETKSKVSSPISNSQYPVPQSNLILAANSSSSNPPVSAIAPKRKRPRPVKYEEEKHNSVLPSRCSSMSSTTKPETEVSAKLEAPNKEDKISGSKVENYSGLESSGHAALPSQLETEKHEVLPTFDLKPFVEESEKREANPSSNYELSSGMKLDGNAVERTATKVTLSAPEKEKQQEENFKIDLMAPARSPEREYGVNRVTAEPKTKAVDVETEARSFFKKTEKTVKSSRKEDLNSENQEEKLKVILEAGSQKPERNIDLKFDLEKCDREDGSTAASGNKLNHLIQKQPHQLQPNTEKTAQTSALPLHMSIPGWPGGLPPMGYMAAPLQGVVSMDGSSLSSAQMQPPHMLFNQPRPKRCATHCYIARNIHYHQQFTKMNPFWPAAAGSAPIYGAKPCNLSLMPPSEIQANASGQVSNSSLDRSSHLASNSADNAAQRKQILIQAGLPPVAASDIMHGPTFIFPLSQQPQATSSVRPAMSGSAASGTGASSTASTSGSAAATPVGATTMSFSYPNMPGNETQYLAFLQNNAYPFPVPAHVGAPPGYRGGPGQTIPFFNGQFYPSQMLHPSHLQPQQQQLPLSQAQQNQKQGNQNLGNTAAPSAAQKQLQNQQQRPGNSSGALQGFPAQKNQSQPLNFQQRQNSHQQSEIAGDDSPSTTDNRVSRFNVTYGQNLMVPMQTSNFGISGSSVPNGGNNSHVEKKAQQQSSKASVEPFMPQPFAMSFSTINGVTAPPGLDMSSAAQNHAMFQSLPEAARQGYKMMAAAVAAQAAQQKINFRAFDDGKHEPNDGSNVPEDRKSSEKTTSTNTGQSIAFSRHDMSNATAVTANNVIDSSARLLNLGSAPARASNGSSMPPAHVQMLRNQQQQQQQILQLQKQQQYAAAAAAASAARSKVPVTSNGTVFPDHNVPSSSLAAVKLPNKLSGLSRNIVQTSGGHVQTSGGHGQSPQWKNNHSSRTSTSQVSSPSMSSSPNPSMKNVTQKVQIRSQQAQISFAANPKSSSGQVQQAPSSNQSQSPPVLGGSPSTSSVSKSAGGSPRTAASTSTGNKPSQASSTLPSQPARNSPSSSVPNQSQSGGRIVVPSVHGNPTALGTGSKPQLSHQQPQQPPKHALQQAQLFFSGAYMQPQQQHSSSNINISPASGYYLQRHQQQTGLSTTSSPLTMCSAAAVSNTNNGTCDPAKAIAGAASSQKQGVTQTGGKTHQLVPPGFPYVHAVPTTLQAKPTDQKQAGAE